MVISSRSSRRWNRARRIFFVAVACSAVIFVVATLQKTETSSPATVTGGLIQYTSGLFSNDTEGLPTVILLGADSGKSGGENVRHLRVDSAAELAPDGIQACRIPKLDINGNEVIKFFEDPPPLKCEKNVENWAYIDENRVFRIHRKAVEKYGKITCKIAHFYRLTDDELKKDPKILIQDGDLIGAGDYIRVYCSSDGGNFWNHLLWTVVPNATRVEELSKIKSPSNWSGLDVYFIGYDSLSQMSFRRKLPKTVKFLEETLEAVVLNGYNIVGDGTPQAFIPILTGGTEEELPLTRRRFPEAHYVDEAYPFAWKNFSDAGYVTLYGEDAASIGTFTFRLKGFKDQPTDHYTRTFFQLAERQFKDMKCFGSIPMHKEWFRYIGEFMHRYSGLAPRFLLAFNSILSHDDINLVQVADSDTAAHLKEMYETGELDNSFVIVMADHGHRFAQLRATQQGQLEERLPFFALSLPKRFRETAQGKMAFENLKANKDRLSTPFDIHATLLDILHWPSDDVLQKPNDLKQRSMSLFRPIPISRTCSEAGIEPHWCTCLNWESAMESEEQKRVSEMLARTVVKTLNSYTAPERKLCAPLHLNSLESSRRLVPHENLLRYSGVKDKDGFVPKLSGTAKASFAHYQLKFKTMPGNALYEVTVKYDSLVNEVTVDMTAISHVNKYGDLPHCIIEKNYFLAAYCICYDKI